MTVVKTMLVSTVTVAGKTPARLRRMVSAAVVAVVLASASTAHAALMTVDSVGDQFTVLFGGNIETQDVSDLSAEATFLVTAFGSNWVNLQVTLTNTTGSEGSGLESRVSALGFDVGPKLENAYVSGLFNTAVLNKSFPNQVGGLDACFKAGGGGNNCSGGGNGGVESFETGIFNIALTFSNPISKLDFDRFAVRYQSISGSRLGTSGTGLGSIGDPTAVPEPTSMLLLGSGLVALATRFRRRLA